MRRMIIFPDGSSQMMRFVNIPKIGDTIPINGTIWTVQNNHDYNIYVIKSQ
jgi:hypothetical protein